jgi:hypothetical protein
MNAGEHRKEMEEMLQNYRANTEHFEMGTKAMAEMYWMRYKALQDAGFTEQQAFAIIMQRGLS